jgi:citrate/tricarballylate utilization protein
MQSLEALTREATALAANEVVARTDMTQAEKEVSRIMQICNACRYCEGFCAVFPAMTRRLEFGRADVHFLANLCHNCGACLHACQYAPPHEFAVNVPQAMAKVRVNTYTEYAWPASFGALYRKNGATVALALAGGLALFLALVTIAGGSQQGSANFYSVFPHNLLVLIFGAVFLLAFVSLSIGVRKFWISESPGELSVDAAAEAAASVLTLKYLGGGHGEGCNNDSDNYSLSRRRFHHLTFYGFMLCFASTCVATLYHYLFALDAPYELISLPVFLGSLGGMSLVVGCSGLFILNLKRHPLHGDASQKGMDRGFIALLWLAALTGLVLLAVRESGAMPVLLAVHLGVVLALFLTLPYGKFAHGIYRSAALLKWAIEKRRPSSLMVEE